MFKSTSRISFVLILFCCLSLVRITVPPVSSTAAEKIPDRQLKYLQKIQKKYRGLTSLEFNFRQTVISNDRTRHGEGNSIFYRLVPDEPGIIRWNYTAPDTQIILNDGKQLSIYTEKDKQQLITQAGDMQADITYSFFTGTRNIKDDFNPLPASPRFSSKKDEKLLSVQLVPKKPHGQIKAVHLWFDDQSVIRRLVMEDHFDTVTELIFSKVKFDALPADSAKTAKKLTQLNLPPDTEVVRQ